MSEHKGIEVLAEMAQGSQHPLAGMGESEVSAVYQGATRKQLCQKQLAKLTPDMGEWVRKEEYNKVIDQNARVVEELLPLRSTIRDLRAKLAEVEKERDSTLQFIHSKDMQLRSTGVGCVEELISLRDSAKTRIAELEKLVERAYMDGASRMKLTEEQIRIKVAGELDWKAIHWESETGPIVGYRKWEDRPDYDGEELPNYPRDLNACAEFESAFTDIQLANYAASLFIQTPNYKATRSLISATAIQRCIAFLRVHGIDAEVCE